MFFQVLFELNMSFCSMPDALAEQASLEKALNFKPGALTMTRLNKMAGIVDDLGYWLLCFCCFVVPQKHLELIAGASNENWLNKSVPSTPKGNC